MAEGPQSPLVAELLRHFTGADVDSILSQIIREKGYFATKPDHAALCRTFGLETGQSLPGIIADLFDAQTPALLDALHAACTKGSATDAKAAAKLARIATTAPTSDDVMLLQDVFLFGKSAKAPFGPKIDSFPTKATRTALGAQMDAINDLMQRVADSRDAHLALLALEKTQALYGFATAFVPAFEARKLAMGMLDFDDLIDKARALLSDSKVADWVLFRLDGGIDHLLVDEAQDTSPAQWAVIHHLTLEFGSGEGARSDRARTVFVVGDKKQSIYSFQGADPAEFDRMQAHFQAMLAGGSHPLQSRE
jgi:ATP-dependent helicase/nuclease subunit A